MMPEKLSPKSGDLERLSQWLNSREPTLMDAPARYAVLVPLVEQNGKLHVLYEVRAGSLRRQPGEVCFPGGRIEGEETPENCAVRETGEELGIPEENLQLLGRLDFIAHRANFIMYPILARVLDGGWEQMRVNPEEVEQTFLVPLEHLLTHPPLEYDYELIPKTGETFPYELIGIPRNYAWQKGGENVPVYPWQGRAIWGLTGRITRHLVNLMRETL